jgi:hypothetical protein
VDAARREASGAHRVDERFSVVARDLGDLEVAERGQHIPVERGVVVRSVPGLYGQPPRAKTAPSRASAMKSSAA